MGEGDKLDTSDHNESGVTNPNSLSRRDFLKLTGIGAAGLSLWYLKSKQPVLEHILEDAAKVPKVNLMFFYEYHEDYPEKLKRFQEMFSRADVFISEIGPWDNQLLDWYRNLEKPEKIETVFDVISGTEKPIFFIDPRKEDSVWHEWESVEKNKLPDFSLTYEEAVIKMKHNLLTEVNVHLHREQRWCQQLSEIVRKLKVDNWFSGKKQVTVMIEAGAYHTLIYHLLSKKPEKNFGKLERVFSENPLILPFREEMLRRILFKKHVPTDQEMSNVMMEAMLKEVYENSINERFIESPSKKASYIRGVLRMIDIDDVRSIFNDFKTIEARKDLSEEEIHMKQTDILSEVFQEKGIEIFQISHGNLSTLPSQRAGII